MLLRLSSPVQVDVVENDGAQRAVCVGLLLPTVVTAGATDLLWLCEVPPDHLVVKRWVPRPEIWGSFRTWKVRYYDAI